MPNKVSSQYKNVQHVKRGSTYRIVCQYIADKEYKEGDVITIKGLYRTPVYAEVQSSKGTVYPLDCFVVYKADHDGKYWARELNEFNEEGRFVGLED